MNFFYLELFLVLSIILVWLGPFIISLKLGFFNFLHPQALTPLWIVYFVINAMIEKWSPWMIETGPGIIRTTTDVLLTTPAFFISPLFFVLLSGFFYHLGVRVLLPSIYSNSSYQAKSINQYKVISEESRFIFLFFAVTASSLAWIPNYIIPNEGLGSFWTFPLAMVNSFLPFMIFMINRVLGVICFIFALLTALLIASKAAFIFPVLPLIFYYFFFHFKIKFRLLSLFVPILILAFLFSLLSIGGFDFVLAKILHRDYAFEVFALLIHYSPNDLLGNLGYGFSGTLNSPSVSWIWTEIQEGIPSVLNPYKGETINPAKLVTSSFLPVDYAVIPNAYFNRFLLFAGYHDFGIFGALLQAFFFGLMYGFFYRRMLMRVTSENLTWPLFVYLPIPCIATYFIASGGLTYGLINSIIPALIILFIVYLSKYFTYIRNS